MEDAEGAEDCLIIITTGDGDMLTLSSTDRTSTKLGLLESARLRIAAQFTKDELTDTENS
jgi:hypothetical protein